MNQGKSQEKPTLFLLKKKKKIVITSELTTSFLVKFYW